jgi:hypothetical protein
MAEGRWSAPRYPLTAYLAGVLAATVPERADGRQVVRLDLAKRFFALLGRAGTSSANPFSDKPLDSVPAVR